MFKKVIAIVILTTMVISIVGCGKKQEAVQVDTTEYEDRIAELEDNIKQVSKELALYDEKYKTTSSFKKKNVLKAGDSGYNKINDKIVLDGEIFPIYENMSNTAKIELSKNVSITPNKNWLISLSTAETTFSSNGAYGTIRIKDFKDDILIEEISTAYLNPFLASNKLDLQSKRDIFVGDDKLGEEVTARIAIFDSTKLGATQTIKASDILDETDIETYGIKADSNIKIQVQDLDKKIDGIIRIGAIKTRYGLVQYEFISESGMSNTIIDNLITTMSIGNSGVHLE